MRRKNVNLTRLLQITKPVFLMTLVLTFTFSLTGCFLLPEDEVELASPVILKEAAISKVNTEKVKRGDIVKKIKFWGFFISPVQSELPFVYMGKLKTVNVAQGDQVKAGDIMAKLESEDIESQLAQLELSLKKAKLNYDKLKTEYDINGGGNKYQLEDAKLNMESVELNIAGLKENLAKISVISPIDGIVAYVDPTPIGENITLMSTFIIVCDRSNMVLVTKKAMIKETMPLGSPVTVSYNGKEYTGKVVKTPEENVNEKNKNFQDAFSFKVDGLDTNNINLNDIASIEYTVQKAENVLIIDKANVKVDGKRNFVYVYKDGAIEEREIEPGIESANAIEVEIKKGLTEQDEVVVQ